MNARKAIYDLTACAAIGFTLAAIFTLAWLGNEAEALPVRLLTGGALAMWACVIACWIGEKR